MRIIVYKGKIENRRNRGLEKVAGDSKQITLTGWAFERKRDIFSFAIQDKKR